MSVATELTRIQTAKSNIKAAIEAKGVSVPSTATIDTYPTYVQEIPQGGGSGETKDYFKITNRTATAGTITITKNGTINPIKLKASSDGTNWTTYEMSATTNITLPANGYVMFDGSENDGKLGDLGSTVNFWSITADVYHDVSGKITSLISPDNGVARFAYLFNNDANLIDASGLKLNLKTLNTYAYQGMFSSCSGLIAAPELPATELDDSCYSSMFYGCSNLVTAPVLSATKLAKACYSSMFTYCSSLVTAPELPATMLVESCYSNMFYGCSNLVTAPVLSATTLPKSCYAYMFYACSSLSSITCFAMTKANNNATQNWVNGINTTGILYVASGNSMNWTQGNNGYPSTWELKVYGEEPASDRTLTISNIPTPPIPTGGEDVSVIIHLETPVDVEQGINTYMEFKKEYVSDEFVVSMTIEDGNGTPVTGYTTAYTNSALTISGPWSDDVTIGYEYNDGDINCEVVSDDYSDYETFSGDTMSLTFPTLVVNGECQCGKDGGDWDEDNQVCLHDAALIIDGVNIPDDGETHEYRILDSDGNTVSVLSIDTSDWSYTYTDDPDEAISHDIATLNVDDYGDLSAGGFRWEVTGFFYGEYDIQLDNTSLISSMPDFDGSSVANYISWDSTEGEYVINTYSCYDEWNCMVNDCGNWNSQDGTCDCV